MNYEDYEYEKENDEGLSHVWCIWCHACFAVGASALRFALFAPELMSATF